ncbi:uncharacterized protein METZ01_LOCUS161486, partial [marine metagenome]
VVALRQVTVETTQAVQLVFSFDALRHDLEPHAVGQCDGAGDDRRVAVVVTESGDERTVDLEEVDGEPLEVGERREAGPEVVQADAHAEAGEVVEHPFGDRIG